MIYFVEIYRYGMQKNEFYRHLLNKYKNLPQLMDRSMLMYKTMFVLFIFILTEVT